MMIPMPVVLVFALSLISILALTGCTLVARRKRVKHLTKSLNELIDGMVGFWLVRPWEGPHSRMPSRMLAALRNCHDRIARARFDATDAFLGRFVQELINAIKEVMAEPGADQPPPNPKELAKVNLESFGPGAVLDKLEQFRSRFAPNQLELKPAHPFTELDCRAGKLIMELITALIWARIEGRRAMMYRSSLRESQELASVDGRMPEVGFPTRGAGLATDPGQTGSQFNSYEFAGDRQNTEGSRIISEDEARRATLALTEAVKRFIRLYELPAK
jgi:hypothetical protein